jgi:hypothetical protein
MWSDTTWGKYKITIKSDRVSKCEKIWEKQRKPKKNYKNTAVLRFAFCEENR